MSTNFSIEALVGSSQRRTTESEAETSSSHRTQDDAAKADSPVVPTRTPTETMTFSTDEPCDSKASAEPKCSAFAPPSGCDAKTTASSEPLCQSQSWSDVLLPHVQMASTNPFLMGLAMQNGAELAKRPGPFAEVFHRNALMGVGVPQRHNPLWSQQWMELLQQAGVHQHRYFPGGTDAHSLFLQPFRKPKRIRTAFSPTQLLQLEDAFEKNHYVVGAERKALGQRLQLSETQVKVWFQNRRTKHKRIKSEEDAKKRTTASSMQKLERNSDLSVRTLSPTSESSDDPDSNSTDLNEFPLQLTD